MLLAPILCTWHINQETLVLISFAEPVFSELLQLDGGVSTVGNRLAEELLGTLPFSGFHGSQLGNLGDRR